MYYDWKKLFYLDTFTRSSNPDQERDRNRVAEYTKYLTDDLEILDVPVSERNKFRIRNGIARLMRMGNLIYNRISYLVCDITWAEKILLKRYGWNAWRYLDMKGPYNIQVIRTAVMAAITEKLVPLEELAPLDEDIDN